MSDTPRTDAEEAADNGDTSPLLDKMRELERELNESRRQHAADNKELNERLTKQQADMQARIVSLREQLTRWEIELTKAMPPDFKDWHQNSRDEWPTVARIVIENLREREASALDQAARLGKPCDWKQDEDGNWDTQCGQRMSFEWALPNEQGYKFCHHCGASINFIKFTESNDA